MKPRLPLSSTLWGTVGLLLVVGLSACGCSDSTRFESPSGSGLKVEFLLLRAASGPITGQRLEIVERLRASESADWTVERCSMRRVNTPLTPGGEKVDAVVIEKQERFSLLRIPGPFDPATFNRVTVRAKWNQKWEAAVELRSKGKLVACTTGRVVAPESGPSTLFFDLPKTRRLSEPIDEIVLRMTDSREPLSVVGIDLVRRPEHLFLPTPESGPGLVLIGEESRRAVGVSSARPLLTSIPNPAGAQLRFSYGVPANMRGSKEKTSLALRILSDGKEVGELEIPLESSALKVPWRQRLVPLDAYGSGDLDVEFKVTGAKPGMDGVCAVGELTLLRSGARNRVVVFVSSDTHRGDHLGSAAEGVEIKTPQLDALAQRGILFEDCFSTTNITNPSHIAMMTGVHPRDTGIHNNYTRVADEAPTLAEAFHDAGYVTFAAISTKHLSDANSGLGQGFDRVSAPGFGFARDASETLELLDAWIDESNGLPVFVWLHLFDAHTPYGKDVPGVARYYPEKRGAFDKNLPELEPHVQRAIKNLRLQGLRDLDYPRAMYKAEITDLDEHVGKLLAKPFFEEAVIGITADHGESLGEHDLYFAHEELYRASLHVPMILCWPGAPAGTRFSGPTSNLNLGRTLLDLSGNLDVDFPGENLTLLLDGESSEPVRFTLSAHAREAAMTQAGWHLQLRLKNNDKRAGRLSRPRHRIELYYLPDDPASDHDLVKQESDRAKSMRASLIGWLASAKKKNWLGADSGNSDSQADLEALGYGGREPESDAGDKAQSLAPAADCDCEWCEPFR